MRSAGRPPVVARTQTSRDSDDVTDCFSAALVVSRPALASIQRLGTTAWVVLETLALDAVGDGDALVARTSARAIADAVSVSKDTAAGALGRLAEAGLIERRRQLRTGGRFGAGGYVLHLPAGPCHGARPGRRPASSSAIGRPASPTTPTAISARAA